ncbi:hypothetical protein [Kitasatospora sp. NPDC092286]|uniref:hypothetical protein n=1 Tax=Kitasatospora sp. NPDC092286 TaxID=3364087 RepID=UPI003801126C
MSAQGLGQGRQRGLDRQVLRAVQLRVQQRAVGAEHGPPLRSVAVGVLDVHGDLVPVGRQDEGECGGAGHGLVLDDAQDVVVGAAGQLAVRLPGRLDGVRVAERRTQPLGQVLGQHVAVPRTVLGVVQQLGDPAQGAGHRPGGQRELIGCHGEHCRADGGVGQVGELAHGLRAQRREARQGPAGGRLVLRVDPPGAQVVVHGVAGDVRGPGELAEVVEAYGEGAAVKALARQHQVAPKTIRRVLDAAGARELPEHLDAAPADPGDQRPVSAPNPAVALDLPGLLADHLRAAGDEAVRQALASGRTIRRGQGHSLRITAPLELHRAALQQSAALAADTAGAAERKAYRAYATRITATERP